MGITVMYPHRCFNVMEMGLCLEAFETWTNLDMATAVPAAFRVRVESNKGLLFSL